jgi:branched-chain amino acid transport system substrate-binding protein
MARAELAANPVPGYIIDVVYDSTVEGDSPEVEVHRAERLAAIPGLVGVVGHGGSRGTLAALPVYDAAGVPLIVPTATSRLLQGAGPWTFVLPPSDSVEGALLARFAVHGLGAQRVSIFYINDEYGVGLRDGALLELQRLGATVVDRVPLSVQNDLATMVEASFTRGRPDVIVVAGTEQMTGVIARAAAERIPGMRVIAGDGALAMPELARSAGHAAGSIYGAAFWAPDADSARDREFVARFRDATGLAPLPSATMNRDAIMLLVQAIRDVGTDRAAIRRWLEQLGADRPPFSGVTGAITFRREAAPRLRIVRVEGESLVPVEFP